MLYDNELNEYLLSKVQHYLPYFINIMLDEINKTARKKNQPIIHKSDVDNAFEKIVKESDHFKDWKSRLFEYFHDSDSAFLNEILIYIAHHQQINKRQLFDLAQKHLKQIDYMDLIEGLEKDGYIVERNDKYVFVSPFLQAFWKRNNPVYDGN